MMPYILDVDLPGNAAGSVIELEEEQATKLVDAGLAHVATTENPSPENAGDEAQEADSSELIQAAVGSISQKMEEAISKTTELVVKNFNRNAKPPVKLAAEVKDLKYGFKNLGDWTQCAIQAQLGNSAARSKINTVQKATGMSEGVPADGGFSVPQVFASEFYIRLTDPTTLLGMSRRFETRLNNISIPAFHDYTHVPGTGAAQVAGISAQWLAEAAPKPISKAALERIDLRMAKLCTVIPLTDELIEDNDYNLTQLLEEQVVRLFNLALNDGILNGPGTTAPLGITTSPAAIYVSGSSASVGGPSTATLNYPNVLQAFRRMYPPSRSTAVWICNPDCLTALYSMAFPDATGTVPVYLPASQPSVYGGQAAFEPTGSLFGKPVWALESCKSGTLIFANLKDYATIYKTNVQSAISIHVYFLTDETALRWVFRVMGSPLWTSVLTPQHGADTLSPFVIVAPAA